MSESQLVTFSPEYFGSGSPDAVAAAAAAAAAPTPRLSGAVILVDGNDHLGVRMACEALAEDFGRVTQGPPNVVRAVVDSSDLDDSADAAAGETVIVVGSLASSALVRKLVDRGQLRVDRIRGKWESFCTAVVERPACAPGFRTAFVIAGSDKRGAIFGVYTLSEQIGVSPWYWWADVPPHHNRDIFALLEPTTSKEPSVKYRGIFINDEAPALTGFVLEKFGCYGRDFYARVFELLLRLKANFLWPAMWPGYPNPGSSFFVDDGGTNAALADAYGIVVSTSHHEPMQRATNEWFADHADGSWSWPDNREAITRFFAEGVERARAAESYFTMGMRGEYDKSMKTDDPAAVVADVLATQRALIKEAHGREDAVPQLLALYKEVQEYWDSGRLDVPDDVTLLFADDNFGTCRRLPSGDEAKRSGGAGIYYHFEYVGAPRSYKWINANSLGKTWHQLQEAYRRNARQIWVFNVGDIKPMEVPLSLAMSLAWDINSIEASNIAGFLDRLSMDMFGYGGGSPTIGEAWREYDQLVSLRRHEHLEASNFSLLHYNEADSILRRWEALLRCVEDMSQALREEYQAAFFQLVLHPVKASAIYTSLRVHQARNRLWAEQRRNSANAAARRVLDLFDADFALSEEFHALADGRWPHMMRQPHYGYGPTWHAPSRDMIDGLCFVQARQDSNPLVGQLGVAVEGHAGVRPGRCNEESDRMRPSRRDLVPGLTLPALTPYGPASRWFDIYTRGTPTLAWTAAVPHAPWVRLSRRAGRLAPGGADVRVHVSVDWDNAPEGFDGEVLIDVRSTGGAYGPYGDDFEQVHLPVTNWRVGPGFDGWAETDGYISIAAAEYDTDGRRTSLLPFYRVLTHTGRVDAGSLAAQPDAPDLRGDDGDDGRPFVTYDVHVRRARPTARLCLEFAMTLDVDPADPMQYDVKVDGRPPQRHRLVPTPDASASPGTLPRGWTTAVQDGVWKRQHELGALAAGVHCIGVRWRHTNMLLEKLVVDMGGVAEGSYLGPPVDRRVNTPACSAGV